MRARTWKLLALEGAFSEKRDAPGHGEGPSTHDEAPVKERMEDEGRGMTFRRVRSRAIHRNETERILESASAGGVCMHSYDDDVRHSRKHIPANSLRVPTLARETLQSPTTHEDSFGNHQATPHADS